MGNDVFSCEQGNNYHRLVGASIIFKLRYLSSYAMDVCDAVGLRLVDLPKNVATD